MNSDLPPLRRPRQIHFQPPARPGNWRMTGKFYCLPPGRYGAFLTFEWTDDLGGRIWLSAQYEDFVASVDARREGRRWFMIEKAKQLLSKRLRRVQ